MGEMADFSGLITYKINDLENYIMPQIDYQIMWHSILKLYIQISFKKVVLIILILIVFNLPSLSSYLTNKPQVQWELSVLPIAVCY